MLPSARGRVAENLTVAAPLSEVDLSAYRGAPATVSNPIFRTARGWVLASDAFSVSATLSCAADVADRKATATAQADDTLR